MATRRGMVLPGLIALPVLAAAAWLSFDRTASGRTHTYYVAAEEVEWDYAPSGMDRIKAQPFEGISSFIMTSGPDRIGRKYQKAIYREYTDSSFTTLKPRAPEWEHLGILGPLLRAEVGDTLRVVFRNQASRPYSMHPHGVFYDKASEGAPYDDGSTSDARRDDAVPTGGTYVYVWPVPERAGPAKGEGSSVVWMYHSHVAEDHDINAGLIGPIIVTAPGAGGPDGRPKDVDREFVVLFGEMDENESHYFEDNIRRYAGKPESVPRRLPFSDPGYLINLKETLNGYSYGHLEGLRMNQGERVRWYVFSSSNFEIHAPHWHGQTVVAHHMRTDVLNIFSMEMVMADMVPDNPGRWMFHCHVGPHNTAGMQAVFEVAGKAVAVR
jgi:FtsP/CotA-like multicopper oxidase with cupredoxin domain